MSCRLCMAAAGLVLVEHTPDIPGLLDLLVFSSQWPPLSTVSHSQHDADTPLSFLPVPAVWKSHFTLDFAPLVNVCLAVLILP